MSTGSPNRTVRRLTRVVAVFELIETTTGPYAIQIVTSLPGRPGTVARTFTDNHTSHITPATCSDAVGWIGNQLTDSLQLSGRVQTPLDLFEDLPEGERDTEVP